MKATTSLIDVIDQLDDVDDSEGYSSPCIFAEGGSDALPTAKALICPSDHGGGLACPKDSALSYVLMVELAKEAIEVCSQWRKGQRPTPDEKFAAVMYYSQHDAWMPVE